MNIYDYINSYKVDGRLNQKFIQDAHREKLKKVMEKNSLTRLDCSIYKNLKGYVLHFKIPSETYKNFYYDAMLCLEQKSVIHSYNIKDYDIKFISNSPDFVYFYAYLFNKENMLFTDFVNKLPSVCINTEPKQNNKTGDISNCKALSWIILYMIDNKMDSISRLSTLSTVYVKLNLDAKIKSFESIESGIKNADKFDKEKYKKEPTKVTNIKKRFKIDTKPSFVKNNGIKKFDTKSFLKK